jgi:hypothetical protein
MAPEGSETVPRIDPPDVWAEAVAAVMTANSVETQLMEPYMTKIIRLIRSPVTGDFCSVLKPNPFRD